MQTPRFEQVETYSKLPVVAEAARALPQQPRLRAAAWAAAARARPGPAPRPAAPASPARPLGPQAALPQVQDLAARFERHADSADREIGALQTAVKAGDDKVSKLQEQVAQASYRADTNWPVPAAYPSSFAWSCAVAH